MTAPITTGNKQPKSPAISTNLAKINIAGQQKAPINSERNINQNSNYQQQQYQGYEQQGLKRNNSITGNEPKGMYDSRMDI